MNLIRFVATLGLTASLGVLACVVQAQTFASPAQVQHAILSGHPQQALQDLAPILKANPRSGEAHYLEAEALDASGQPALAKKALQVAEKLSPSMPFARKTRLRELEARLGVTNPHTRSMHHVLEAFAVFALLVLALLGFLLVYRKRQARREMTEAVQALMGTLNASVKTLQGWLPEAQLKGVSHGLSEQTINNRLQEAAKLIAELQNLLESDFDEERWKQLLEDVRSKANLTSPWEIAAPGIVQGQQQAAGTPDVWVAGTGGGQSLYAAPAAPAVVMQQPSYDPLSGALETALVMDALQPRPEIIEREVVQAAPSTDDWDAPSRLGASSQAADSWGASSDDGLPGGADSSDSGSDAGWDGGADDGLSGDAGTDWN